MAEKDYRGFKKLSSYLGVYENNLDVMLCSDMIEKFKNDDRKYPARTVRGERETLKRTNLDISELDDWLDYDKLLYEALKRGLKNYPFFKPIGPTQDVGFMVCHQGENDHYDWHSDAHWELNYNRIVTFLWYLNTLEDGHTEFGFGTKIKPEVGRLLLFPANLMYIHRSCKTETDKYICTGWIYEKSHTADNPLNTYLE